LYLSLKVPLIERMLSATLFCVKSFPEL